MAPQNTNDNVSARVTRNTDGSFTASVTGSADQVGDVLERFGRGVGYGIEKARLEAGGQALLEGSGEPVYISVCKECKKRLTTAKSAFYRMLSFQARSDSAKQSYSFQARLVS